MNKKNRLTYIVVILTILVYVILLRNSHAYRIYANHKSKEVFGKEALEELNHISSIKERKIGKELIAIEKQCLIDKKIDARTQVLHEQFFSDKDGFGNYLYAKFLSCKIKGDEGHLWIACTDDTIDKKSFIGGPSGMDDLILCYIAKEDGVWKIVGLETFYDE